MLTEDVKCPKCGMLNCSLYLEETDGWMECCSCGCTVLLRRTRARSSAGGRDIRWRIERICTACGSFSAAGTRF